MAPVASCSGRSSGTTAMLSPQLRHAERGGARKPPPAMLSSPGAGPSVRILEPHRAAGRGSDLCSTSRCVFGSLEAREQREERLKKGQDRFSLERRKKNMYTAPPPGAHPGVGEHMHTALPPSPPPYASHSSRAACHLEITSSMVFSAL